MVRYKCVVIEDEPLAAEILTDYISQVPFLELRQVYSDAITALEFLKSEKADVILSFDADLLGRGPAHLRYTREFSKRRDLEKLDSMTRLYVAESTLTLLGGFG